MGYIEKVKLNNWRLKVVEPSAQEKIREGRWAELPGEEIPASVPGDWVLDYVKAGLFPDPFFGDNFTKLYKYERHHLFYRTVFTSKEGDECTFLRFEGIDTVADIYLNGEKIGHTENMFTEHELSAEKVKKGENELVVHIFPVYDEARKYDIGPDAAAFKYNFESLSIRKATHMFGWDICPRILGGGLWKDVFLLRKKKTRIERVFLTTQKIEDGVATLKAEYAVENAEGCEIEIKGRCGESVFSARGKANGGRMTIAVKEPKLWWVRGYGQPELYEVTATLFREGEEIDSTTFLYGIRTIELIADAVTTAEKRGEFVFVLNGKRIYIKGTNWVPCDAFHCRDAERMPAILDLVTDCGCNALRVWGGGIYESDYFYNRCDEEGIFVWQDFMMACAIYPQTERMKSQLREEVTKVVRRLRNHPSLCLWAGDNECDVAYLGWFGRKTDPSKNSLTRQLIPNILQKEDGSRPYLPSSPYMSPEAVERKLKSPEQHLWGPRKYFKGKFYRENTATFASEMGYHGCPSVESVKKFIPKDRLWGCKWNEMWLYHAASPEIKGSPYTYRIRLMARQIFYFFGEKPRSLAAFSGMSQVVQAEAMKYFVESFRCKKGKKTGLIWWNIMDCWPQFSDAVVDYYFDKKRAYYYIKNSQQALCLMINEEKGGLKLYAANDLLTDKEIEYAVTAGKKTVAAGKAIVKADSSVELCPIKGRGRFFVIRWKTADGEGKNHYLKGRPFFAYRWYKKTYAAFFGSPE